MTKKVYLLTLSFLISMVSFSQDRTIDSLLLTRKTDSLNGKVKTYYSPGHKKIAAELQQFVTGAIAYYEKKYSVHFNIQMIVLDSTQWFKEVIPYGFVFYDDTHWLVLNTGMAYEDFKSVYGFKEIAPALDSAFKKNHLTAEEVIYARLKFLSLHELGHYFINVLSNAQSPDTWTNEFIAWYFANEYISKKAPEVKRGFDIFCRTIADHYPAEHTSLIDFNKIYFKLKIGNFAWYHSRFYFLADSLYSAYGLTYLKIYERLFPKNVVVNYSFDQIINSLDKRKTGIAKRWVLTTESNGKVH